MPEEVIQEPLDEKPMRRMEAMRLISKRLRNPKLADVHFVRLAELLCGLHFGRRGPDIKLRKRHRSAEGFATRHTKAEAAQDSKADALVDELVRKIEQEKKNG